MNCPTCGTHEVSLERTCHNSACSAYAREETVYEGWKPGATLADVLKGAAKVAAQLSDTRTPFMQAVDANVPKAIKKLEEMAADSIPVPRELLQRIEAQMADDLRVIKSEFDSPGHITLASSELIELRRLLANSPGTTLKSGE